MLISERLLSGSYSVVSIFMWIIFNAIFNANIKETVDSRYREQVQYNVVIWKGRYL